MNDISRNSGSGSGTSSTIIHEKIEERVSRHRDYYHEDANQVGSFQGSGGGGAAAAAAGEGGVEGGGGGRQTSQNKSFQSKSSSSSFPHSYDYGSHQRNKRRYGIDYKNTMDSNNFDANGSIDIELVMLEEKCQKSHISSSSSNSDGEGTEAAQDGGAIEAQAQAQANKGKGIVIKPIKNQMNVSCYVPPKCGANAFASFNGKTGFLHQRGYTDTTLSLGYHLFRGNTILYDWHTQDGTSKMSFGASHTSKSKRYTYTEAKLHYPPSSVTAGRNSFNSSISSQPSLALRNGIDVVPNKIRGTVEMKFDGTILSSSPTPFLSSFKLGLSTLHENDDDYYNYYCSKSNNKPNAVLLPPQLRLYLNFFSSSNAIGGGDGGDPFAVKLEYIRPRIDTSSSLPSSQTEVSIGIGGGTHDYYHQQRKHFPLYQFQILFTRYLSQFSLFSTGIELDFFKGLSWLFRWKRGDVCFNVPIRLSSLILGTTSADGSMNCYSIIANSANGTVTTRGHYDLLYHTVSTTYVTFLSYVIDVIIGDVIQNTRKRISDQSSACDEAQNQQEQQNQASILSSSLQKAKQDAQLQMELMRRKSKMNRNNEEKKSGLVIVEATYGVQNGECMDVTIQLQFWVADSRLHLTSNSKSQMLGFYDVSNPPPQPQPPSSDVSSVEHNNSKERKRFFGNLFGLVELWESLYCDDHAEDRQMNQIPFLKIRYKFNSICYDIIILDDESLALPSPRAVKVGEQTLSV